MSSHRINDITTGNRIKFLVVDFTMRSWKFCWYIFDVSIEIDWNFRNSAIFRQFSDKSHMPHDSNGFGTLKKKAQIPLISLHISEVEIQNIEKFPHLNDSLQLIASLANWNVIHAFILIVCNKFNISRSHWRTLCLFSSLSDRFISEKKERNNFVLRTKWNGK